MKVLHLIAPISFGGGESLLLNLLSHKVAGTEEEIALLFSAPRFEDELKKAKVRFQVLQSRNLGFGVSKRRIALEGLFLSRCMPAFVRLVRRGRFDVVHVHGFPGSLFFAQAKRLFFPSQRAIYTHHFIRNKPGKVEEWLLSKTYGAFDAFTGVSNLVSRSMEQSFPSLAGKFSTVYNCVGDRFYDAQADTKALPVAKGRAVFVQVARFSGFKNQALVVDSVAKLPPSVRERFHVLFVGDGPERTRVESQVAEAGLGDSFTFAGALSPHKVPSVIAGADFGLFPSENEGFGIGAAECLAVGRPVLAMDNELMREVVGGGGVLQSRASFSDGFGKMLELGPALVPAAKKRADHFRVAAIKSEYGELYRKVAL